MPRLSSNLAKFRNKYRIETARLDGWDYATPWWYFVTIVIDGHKEYFGKIEDEKLILSDAGKIADYYWQKITNHYSFVEIDEYVIMPNHIHGILVMDEQGGETGHAPSLRKKTLGNIVGSYKSAVTKRLRNNEFPQFKWQTRFYDRIIRTEQELYNIRKYISENPLKWEVEKEIPENLEF